MALSPALSDFGSADSIVDRRIGTAFQYVQVVANNIKEVKYVAHYMESIALIAANFANEVTTNIAGMTLVNPLVAVLPFPLGVDISMVKASDVLVQGIDGDLYMAGANTFSVKISTDGLSLTLAGSAPSNLESAQIMWHLTHTPAGG